MDLKYLTLHKDIWFYRRRFPRKVCQATGKEFFRRSLKLGRQASIGDIAQAWQIAHEYFEFVIKDPCLDLKDGFRPTNTANQSGLINPKRTDSESPLLLSQCWDLYAAAREIDINTREGKRIFSRWHKWLTISGDSYLEQRNVESKLDSYQALRLKQVSPSSVKRELNLVMAVIRFAAKSKRVPLTISSAPLPRHKPLMRKTLSQSEQIELVTSLVSNEFNLAASVALLLYLQGGVITSETQRLKKTSVFPNASVPFLLIESETKTEARKRVVPITVANSWIKEALEKLEDTSDMALGNDWCALTESGAHKRLDRILPDGVSPYGLRHSFRANAIASDAGDNAAIIGGWKSSNGLSPIMFNYGQDAFCRTETLKGLERTSKKINQHLIEALN